MLSFYGQTANKTAYLHFDRVQSDQEMSHYKSQVKIWP